MAKKEKNSIYSDIIISLCRWKFCEAVRRQTASLKIRYMYCECKLSVVTAIKGGRLGVSTGNHLIVELGQGWRGTYKEITHTGLNG